MRRVASQNFTTDRIRDVQSLRSNNTTKICVFRILEIEDDFFDLNFDVRKASSSRIMMDFNKFWVFCLALLCPIADAQNFYYITQVQAGDKFFGNFGNVPQGNVCVLILTLILVYLHKTLV